jgi:hypothetical protein
MNMSQETMNNVTKYGPAVLGIAGIVATFILAAEAWSGLDYQMDLTQLTAVLGSLFVVALFLERALAVVNDLLFGYEKEEGEERLRSAHTLLDAAQVQAFAASEGPTASNPDQKHLTKALNNINDATEELNLASEAQMEVDLKRKRLRLGLGFLVAVLIAGMGVRTLGQLVEPPPLPPVESEQPTPRPTNSPVAELAPAEQTGAPADPAAPPAGAAEEPPPANEDAQQPTEKHAPRGLFDWLDILLTAGLLAGGSSGIGSLIDAIGRRRPNPNGNPLVRARLQRFQ